MALGTLAWYLPALACPAMMILCTRGMQVGGKQAGRQTQAQTQEERRQALQVEMPELDRERLARGEITPERYLRLHGPEAITREAERDAVPARLATVAGKRRPHVE